LPDDPEQARVRVHTTTSRATATAYGRSGPTSSPIYPRHVRQCRCSGLAGGPASLSTSRNASSITASRSGPLDRIAGPIPPRDTPSVAGDDAGILASIRALTGAHAVRAVVMGTAGTRLQGEGSRTGSPAGLATTTDQVVALTSPGKDMAWRCKGPEGLRPALSSGPYSRHCITSADHRYGVDVIRPGRLRTGGETSSQSRSDMPVGRAGPGQVRCTPHPSPWPGVDAAAVQPGRRRSACRHDVRAA
jgi:hypothetical protein